MPEKLDVSRREVLKGATVAIAAVTAVPVLIGADAESTNAAIATISADASVPRTTIQLTVNGTRHTIEAEDRWTLAELLRDNLGLTGTKLGCDRGECGACTVLLDGKPVYACSNLAVWADGRSVLTVEGLEKNGKLDPLQQSFMDHDAPQCGFCTSGQLMSAKALLNSNPHPTADEVRAAMTGNICRCSNYNRYVEAVMAVAGGN
jgi:xanthine dehydrogenase YagT iron-sulfur-binding subunit